MRKTLFTGIMAGVLFLLFVGIAPAADYIDFFERPCEADAATSLPVYADSVTATVTDTEVALVTITYSPDISGRLQWVFADLDIYLKCSASATGDIIWRIEAKNVGYPSPASYWDVLNHDFVITSSNDVMSWAATGAAKTTDVADGTYTGSTLATALQTAIRAQTGLQCTSATVEYSDTTHLFTFDFVSRPVSADLSSGDMCTTIGFDRDVSAVTEMTTRFATPAYYEANIGTSWVQKRYYIYARLDSTLFYRAPFQLRIVFQCNEGAEGMGRYSSNTYIRGVFKEGSP